ncbi:MAG: TIR domain-containing protein [Nitrosomonas sp.]|nr:MAG: TIR domain-containing protein [Nitrosomonas sp.]
MAYNAFISYSHAADGKLAPALHTALHRIARPWNKIRALHIFRDHTNLSIAPELWGTILNALSDSQYFILLASPGAAASKWVQQEVSYWLENKSKNTLLIVLTEGDIGWDSERNDFDWNLTTVLPQNLRNVFTAEPFYIDLRQQKRESQLSLRDPLFLDAAATIAATLHGVSKDEIVGEDLKQHQITKRLVRFTIIVLIGLLVAVTFGFYTAEKQKDATLVEKLYVQANSAIQNPGDMNGDPVHAHLLAAQAYQLQPDNPTAYKALLSTLLSSHTHQYLHGHTQDIHKAIYSPDGNYLASVGDDGLILWKIHQDKVAKKWVNFDSAMSAVAFSPDNQQVVTGGKNGDLIFWDSIDGKKHELIVDKNAGNGDTTSQKITSISFSTDGKQLLTATEGGMLKLWDVITKKVLKAWRGHKSGTIEAVFHPTSNGLAISYPVLSSNSDYHMRMWSLVDFKEVKRWQISSPSEEATKEPTAVSPDGQHLLSKYLRNLLFWNIDSHEVLKKKLELKNGEILLDKAGHDLFAFSSAGNQFVSNEVSITSSLLTVWNINHLKTNDKNQMIKLKDTWNDVRSLHSLAFSPDGKKIVGGGKDGRLVIWNVSAGESLSQSWIELSETDIDGNIDFAFSHNEKRIASIVDYSVAKVFDYDSTTGKFVLTHKISSSDIAFRSIALSQDGKQLLLGGNDDNGTALEIWSLTSDKSIFVKKLSASGNSFLRQVAFTQNNKKIYGITEDGILLSWDTVSFKKKEIPLKGNADDSIKKAAFSPDRKILMASSDSYEGIKLWETATGECYKGFKEDCRIQPGHEESSISGLAFSPDGKLAISTSEASLWVLWDVATGDVIVRKQHNNANEVNEIWGTYFLSNSKILFSTLNYEKEKRWVVWDTRPANLAAHACEVAGRHFTLSEWNKFIGNELLDYEKRACKKLAFNQTDQ